MEIRRRKNQSGDVPRCLRIMRGCETAAWVADVSCQHGQGQVKGFWLVFAQTAGTTLDTWLDFKLDGRQNMPRLVALLLEKRKNTCWADKGRLYAPAKRHVKAARRSETAAHPFPLIVTRCCGCHRHKPCGDFENMAGLEQLVTRIYHERQEPGSALCAQHALNSLLRVSIESELPWMSLIGP